VADDEGPAFGPSGYLPERASKRARKIVLRAPLGLQWIVGALAAGVLLVLSGVALFGADDTPQAPFAVAVADVGTLPPSSTIALDGREALVVSVGGRPRVFLPGDGAAPVWCEASGLLEDGDGGAWRGTGRGVAGTPSLRELPALVSDGALYVDATRPLPPARPDEDGPTPAC
jgi:hypothetical protein